MNRPHREMVQQDQKLARAYSNVTSFAYGTSWRSWTGFRFAPLDAFNYNVHIGLDVGGRHNNHAMACLGYGFSSPKEGLFFRPEEIPIDVQKAEPIPTECLTRGLLQLIEQVHSELVALGVTPDLERLLLFRDGKLMGDGDDWNEIDAIRRSFQSIARARLGQRASRMDGRGSHEERRGVAAHERKRRGV